MSNGEVQYDGGSAAPPGRSAKRPDGGGGEATLRLDQEDISRQDTSGYRIIMRDYGEGLAEIGWSFVFSLVPKKSGRGLSEDREAHEDRAMRRARSRLRQLVLSANADYLLTLTYRANVADFRQANADLGRFTRLVKMHLPTWVYIAVPERQKRGAWHWHLAVVGWQDVGLLRACWLKVVGDGNIDVQERVNATVNRRLGIVKYLGNYLTKGFKEGDRELNGHRFRASLGIKVPSQSIRLPAEHRNDVFRYALDELQTRAGAVGYHWVEMQGLAGWACSWK